MKKAALALTLAAVLTACAQLPSPDGTTLPAIAPSEDTVTETRAPDSIVTGSCGTITTAPVTTADPNAPIETITHHMTPGVTVPPFTTAPIDPAEPLEAVPCFTVEPVTDRSTAVRFSMNNRTGKIVWTSNTGFPLKLERKEGGEWVSVTAMPGQIRTAESYVRMRTVHGESRKYSYDIMGNQGGFLTPGEYRIPFQYDVTGKWEKTYVCFSVTAAPDAYPLAPVPDTPGTVTLDFAANPADTPGLLLLRMTNTTDRRVTVNHLRPSADTLPGAPVTLQRLSDGEWVTVEPDPIDPADRVNTESTSARYISAADPGQSRIFAFAFDRYPSLAPGEYRIPVRYGTANPPSADEPHGSFGMQDPVTAAWHFTVTE